ncbi:MAG: RNA polymerase sigma factor [Bacteroidales bacterium]|uniref:RNA polymerase sigma factor n=1 Tax=Porphyromonas sp. TaxID=1924944 RepID=UPI002970D8A1|nr:RNA polymerase sigma factor [Porphyromonas sp.]MDD7438863.1 RNA polymerase sigma factor [Bacteroidales bacterium]MDY3067317.1 RNA polymerase sigma factor [Porphyromonas sp.]
MKIPSNISDERLIELLHSEKDREAAFGILVNKYSQQLYAVIRRIVYRHEDTDDVLQNTFIKIWKNIDGFKGDSKLSTWMYTIATNEALSHLRREKASRKLPISTEEYDLAEMLTSDPYFDGDEAEAKFMAAIEELPEKQKITFELRYFQDLSYKEISEITNTSEGALKANYHHAVKKLRVFLGIDDAEE